MIKKIASNILKFNLDSKDQKVKLYTLKGIVLTLLSLVIVFVYSLVFDTPEEYALKIENAKFQKNINIIHNQLDSLNSILAKIQQKDDNLYRLVLGVDPIAEEIRSAGIGGTMPDDEYVSAPNELDFGIYRKEIGQLNARLKVQFVSFNDLTKLATENVNRLKHTPSIYPIAPEDLIRYASGFGYRTHPIFNIRKFHKGIDLTALKGSPIYSTAKGKVIIAANLNDGYGNKVVIDHGYGYKTVYAHMHKIEVKRGQDVDLGELLGQVGNTGLSVSPHLHYEVRYNDQVINPLQFIYKDISLEEYRLITKR